MEGCTATNLAIDDKILEKARRVGGLRTKKETVTRALEEFVQRRQQRKILRALGTFRFRKDWNYKADRRGPHEGEIRHTSSENFNRYKGQGELFGSAVQSRL